MNRISAVRRTGSSRTPTDRLNRTRRRSTSSSRKRSRRRSRPRSGRRTVMKSSLSISHRTWKPPKPPDNRLKSSAYVTVCTLLRSDYNICSY